MVLKIQFLPVAPNLSCKQPIKVWRLEQYGSSASL